jgi:hypothetical protein
MQVNMQSMRMGVNHRGKRSGSIALLELRCAPASGAIAHVRELITVYDGLPT